MARVIGSGFVEIGGQGARLSTVAIMLAEKSDSLVRWNVDVDATTKERGTMRVGRVLTVPPAWFVGLPGGTPRSSSRVVAFATCANAESWKVTARAVSTLPSSDPAATAQTLAQAVSDFTMTAIDIPLQTDGVVPVNADAIGLELAEGSSGQLALAAGVQQLVAPYDPDRQRLVVSAAAVGDLNAGFTDSANVTSYFRVPAAQIFETRTHRPVWLFSVAGTTATFWIEKA